MRLGTCEWRSLAMFNFAVEPRLLMPYVPRGTQLDLVEDKAWMSLIGFIFMNTRLFGVRVPFVQHYQQVNLAFYVQREVEGELRRGIALIKEIVPRRVLAAASLVFQHERFTALPMRQRIITAAGGVPDVFYEWCAHGQWSRLHVRGEGRPFPAPAHSMESYFSDRFWSYTTLRDHSTSELKHKHPPWRFWSVRDYDLRCRGLSFGKEFDSILRRPPDSVFLAKGSPVVFSRTQRLTFDEARLA